MKKLLYVLIGVVLVSCGTQNSGKSKVDKQLKKDMWSYVGPAPKVNPSFRNAIFILDEKPFIDSLRNRAMTSSDAQIQVILPIPDVTGTIWEYRINRIYDIGNKVDSSRLGFMAINVDNKDDIATLYLVNDRLIGKWQNGDLETMMTYYQTDSLGHVMYLMVEKNPNLMNHTLKPVYDVE